jgi:hypothetical protein
VESVDACERETASEGERERGCEECKRMFECLLTYSIKSTNGFVVYCNKSCKRRTCVWRHMKQSRST